MATDSPFVEVLPGATDPVGVGELFDLKKSAKVFFGDGDGATVGEAAAVAFVLCFFSAGEAEAAADAAGEASVVAFAFFERLAGEGDASAALASGDAAVVASAFL